MQYQFPSKKEIFSIPNIMGYFRILLLPFIAYGILKDYYLLQIILLAISALTDFLDGKIARKFNMVTNLGKALDPVADKLTLCVLFFCLMFKNDYAKVIAIVMLVKECYMLVMQIVLKKKCGKTTGGAKWYGKICTASLFLALGAFLLVPHMTAMTSNVIMVIVVFIMLYTLIMYSFLFKSLRNPASDRQIHPSVRAFAYTLLILVLYMAAGATLPFIYHPKVSTEYNDSIQLSDYVSSTNTSGTDRVRLVSSNEDALTERIRLIDMAEDSIILSTFDFRAGKSGKDVAAALCDAANRGVDVKILVDGFSGILKMDGEDVFYELASTPNIELKIYNPVNVLEPWNLMGRMHDKYLIVDDYGYLLGGRNTYDLFLGSYNTSYKNIDLEVFVWNEGESENSSLYQVKNYFDSVWNLSYCEEFHYPANFHGSAESKKASSMLSERLNTLHSNYAEVLSTADSKENTLPAGKIQLISNPIHRNNKEPYVWNTLYKLMDSAKERVYLHTPYIICDNAMYEGLTAIGHKDIDTKLLLNSPEIGANPFGCSDYLSEKSNVLATGFSVYEYMGANSSYHTKAVLIDDNLSIVGSYNTDMRSTYLDTELMLSIEGEEFNAALEAVMNEAESQCKHTISEDDYTIPSNITEAVFDDKERRKYKFIILLTRPIRFLL